MAARREADDHREYIQPFMKVRGASRDEREAGRANVLRARRLIKEAYLKFDSFKLAMQLFKEAEASRMLISPERCRDLVMVSNFVTLLVQTFKARRALVMGE